MLKGSENLTIRDEQKSIADEEGEGQPVNPSGSGPILKSKKSAL
jgi:hypothetical protein